MRILLFSMILILSTSCAEFYTGRTYLSEMERESSTYFNPEDDFPVVAGDTGEMSISDEERQARTPASIHDIQSRSFNSALKHELRDLENSQSEGDQKLYNTYKHRMASTSDRIYFLKLPPHERREYLEARGFIEAPKAAGPSDEQIRFGVRRNEVMLGMKKNDVLDSLGKPERVEIAGNPSYQNERWAYRVNGNTTYIYFESGEVQGWE